MMCVCTNRCSLISASHHACMAADTVVAAVRADMITGWLLCVASYYCIYVAINSIYMYT